MLLKCIENFLMTSKQLSDHKVPSTEAGAREDDI